jgi:hypothetical protein
MPTLFLYDTNTVEFNYRIKGMKNVNDELRFNACYKAYVS